MPATYRTESHWLCSRRTDQGRPAASRRPHGSGVFAVGLLGHAVSSADTGGNNCSYATVGSILNITCNGQVNDVPVTVNIDNVASGNDLSVLENSLNNAFVSVAHISDINILSVDL